jgi:hypothetical protein
MGRSSLASETQPSVKKKTDLKPLTVLGQVVGYPVYSELYSVNMSMSSVLR